MARWFYSLVFYFALPVIVLRLLLRSLKAPAYRRRLHERFAVFKKPALRCPIWVHAVSVGETIAAEPVIRHLQQQFPDRDIVVTTMTPTGSERVRALFGDSVFHVYAPYDTPDCVRRFLRRINPTLLIIMETELWPNTLFGCRQQDVPAVLINARLSAKSAIGYQNVSLLSRPMLQNLSAVIAQTEADANRFHTLGVNADKLYVSGSIKFDVSLSDALREEAGQLKIRWAKQRPVWIAASTHDGEDELLLNAFDALLQRFPDLLLVLVPRHPERFNTVAQLCEQRGFTLVRRSSGMAPEPETQVLLGDTMGELLLMFGVADISFIGGSLVPRGGHNMLEAAAWQQPIITGPSDFNFSAISEKLVNAGALVKVEGEQQLIAQMDQWLRSSEERKKAGAAAASVIAQNRGVLTTVFQQLEPWL